jgi:multidrug efflux system membrane fusion protein
VLILTWRGLSDPARAAKPSAAAERLVPVEMAPAARADVPIYLEGLGTVRGYYTVTVTARVDGQLERVAFVEGQSIRQGELLAQIDPRPYQAALDQASAAYAKTVALLAGARSDLTRYELLAPKDLASRQTLETQRALVNQLQAQIKADEATVGNARTQLGYTAIKASINGRTGIRRIDPGNIVRAADTNGIVVLTQIQPIACIFTLPEESLPAILRAMAAGPVPVTAISRDGKTELDHGTVALIDNQIDETTGTIRVKAIFPNAHDLLWPGEFVNARVLVQVVRGALTVPAAAVQRGPGGAFTYIVRPDSSVEVRSLEIEHESGDVAIIAGGLREGELTVTSNHYRVLPGVHVRNSAASSAPGRGKLSKLQRP